MPQSVRVIRLILPILAVVGIGISGYLTFVHYSGVSPICLPGFHCDAVLSSPYSAIWGVPLSLFGAVVYALIALLGFWHLRQRDQRQALGALFIYMFALAGVVFTIYLYYLEIFVIHAFCAFCIASSVVMACLFVLSIININSTAPFLKNAPRDLRVWISHYVQW